MSLFVQTVLQISISIAAVIGLLLLLVPVWQKRYSARWRKVIWLVIAIRLLVPFSLELLDAPVTMNMNLEEQTGLTIPVREPVYADTHYDMAVAPENQSEITNSEPQSYMETDAVSIVPGMVQQQEPVSYGTILFAVWIIGAVAFALWHGVQYAAFRRRVLASAVPLEDGEWLLQNAGKNINLPHLPDILISAEVQGPMLTGFLKPVILLPERIYGEQELLLILRHELMHYKHYDLWYKLVLLLANAVHWFNPLVWMMNRQAGRDVEQVCDDAVVAGQDMDYRKAYSMTILNTMASQRGIALSTYLSKEAQNTKKRFAGILQPKQYKKGVIVLAVIILLATVASGCLQFTKPVAGAEYLERIENYLPEGMTFSDSLTYEQYDSSTGSISHHWTDWEDSTGTEADMVKKNAANSCWITMVTDADDNVIEYSMNVEPGYREKENLPAQSLSDKKAKKLAEKFLADLSGEEDCELKAYRDVTGTIFRYQELPEDVTGWIADSTREDYHYEVRVNTEYGHVVYYRSYFDNAQQREQLAAWLRTEAMEPFMPYPRIRSVSAEDNFMYCWREGQNYWMRVSMKLDYFGEYDVRSADSIWSKHPADAANAEGLYMYLPVQVCAPEQEDGTLNLEQCQMFVNEMAADGNRQLRQISGFEVFIGLSQNAMPNHSSGESTKMLQCAEHFAHNIAALSNAQDEAARKRVQNHPILQVMKLPEYAYVTDSDTVWESIHTDFFRRYGQLGNDGESYEPVALSAEMQKEDGSTDTLTMWLVPEDGEWKVADAVLEPFVESEEPLSFWEYSGYLDAFPWENTGDSPQFSYDYDGDGEIDRVYRSRTQYDDYYQYQIEFANADILKIEEPIADVGYPQIDGVDLTGDGQNEIIFRVSYPTSTNPMAVGELAVFERNNNAYQLMKLPFETEEDSYVQKFSVTYNKADGQAVEVSVAGTDFKQVIPIDDDLWNGYLYKDNFANGETMESTVWAYKIQQQDGRYQMVCSVQLFDKWSDDGLDIVLDYQNHQFVIEEVIFCDDIYEAWAGQT